MKEILRQAYKNISHKYPTVGELLKRIYYKKLFNTIKRRIKGKNNIVKYNNARLSSVLFYISGDHNRIEIEDDCILNNVEFHINGNNHRVLIESGCRFNQGGNIWVEDDNCLLSIGNNSTFENVHFALIESNSTIIIGPDCLFSYDIDVRTSDSHSIISEESNKRINYAENVSIGKHVWVGAHSILLKGCTIADNSVVATGSVVTKKFDQKGIIIGGNPAKQIKEGITWSGKRINKDS